MKKADDIVVTGIGTISSIGNDKETFWENLIAGVSGADTIRAFDPTGFGSTIACEVKDFNPQELMDKRRAKRMARFSQLAVCSALAAWVDAGLDINSENPARIGSLVSSGAGDYENIEIQHRTLLEKGPLKGHPLVVPKIIPNMAAGNVAIELGIHGPNFGVVSACATGAHTLALAAQLLRLGQAEIMVAGGAESTISPLAVDAYACMKVLSTRNNAPRQASRPFDAGRDGFVIGEGAAVLVLERRDRAQNRGARIYATLAGAGMTADAQSIAAPDVKGRWAAEAMRIAMKDAGLNAADVGYINAHGTSTRANDSTETRAIKDALGSYATTTPVSSIKSMIGHTLGAAGAIEAAATVLSLYHGILPPTINQENPDPECDLDYIPNEARSVRIRAALSNSFGFGGQNGVLAFLAE
ncbi:beta-ketoacyl-ACP synthase II [Marispirochaeta sp.]|jgi:3-oxoacyl-[acyl-carrier-protein] synthase II|uniref:beta-ketoacyl-ACP synthase II n=1 Tax=Marispirochaeta sp. TaxID=2038653 RepID=UPI0029C7ABFE|nr:beta-ketoacyl-ACP synthase II [Marispirochaeta sp.]